MLLVIVLGGIAAWRVSVPDGGSAASETVIGLEGGNVPLGDNGGIEFAPGTFSDPTSVLVSVVRGDQVPGEAPLDAEFAGRTYRVDIASSLGSPALVTLPFDPGLVETPPAEVLLFVGRFDETSRMWEPLLGTADWETSTVTVRTEHFSLLAVFQRSAEDFARDLGNIFTHAAEGALWAAGLETAEGPICTKAHPEQVERIEFSDSLLPCIEERDTTTIALQVVNNRPYGQLIALPLGAAVVQLDQGGFWDRIWGLMQSSLNDDVYLPPGARVTLALPAEGAGDTYVHGRPDGTTLALDLATEVALSVFPTQVHLLVPFMECVVAGNQHAELPEGRQLVEVARTIRDCLNTGLLDEYLPSLLPHWAITVGIMRGTVMGTHGVVDVLDGDDYVRVRYREQAQKSSDTPRIVEVEFWFDGERVVVIPEIVPVFVGDEIVIRRTDDTGVYIRALISSEPGPELTYPAGCSVNTAPQIETRCVVKRSGIETHDLIPFYSDWEHSARLTIKAEPAPSSSVTVLPIVGSRVTVIGTGDCLRIRSQPTTASARIGCLRDGTKSVVEDGPREADGYRWYRLQGHGWAAGEFLATETVLELVRAISEREPTVLAARFGPMSAPCGGTPAYPIPCDGRAQGTRRTIYRFHDIPAPGCGAGGYDDARSAVEAFFRQLPPQPTALEIRFAELPMSPGEPQLVYRRLDSGDFVARVRLDPDSGMIVDLSTVPHC